MIKIGKPETIKQDVLIDDLTSNMHTGAWKNNILSSKDFIVRQSKQYDSRALEWELYKFSTHDSLEGGATKEDMKKLYEQKFVKKGQPGRKYYDKLLLKAPNRKCPYCGQREVATVDHYLPKAHYPVFAVTPENLVPSCRDCNTTKLDAKFEEHAQETLHPYYDDFTEDIWIKAKMILEDSVFFVFYAEGPEIWDEEKKQRAKAHFEAFDLDKGLYRSMAIDCFPYYESKINRAYKRGGKDYAIQLLKEDIEDL